MHAPSDHPLDEFVQRCRDAGLRRTHALEAVLQLLMAAKRPLSASDIVESPALKDQCDPATVYRLLTRLDEKGILRRLGLRERSAYYTLRHGHCHEDYIVCTACGMIESLAMDCPVETLEAEISRTSGFSELDHALEFFGVCPACQEARAKREPGGVMR